MHVGNVIRLQVQVTKLNARFISYISQRCEGADGLVGAKGCLNTDSAGVTSPVVLVAERIYVLEAAGGGKNACTSVP